MKDWVFPTLGSVLVWGLWAFIPKFTVRYLDPKSAIVYQMIGGVLLGAIALFSLQFRLETNPKGILLAGATGMLGFLGGFFYLMAANRGPISLVSTLSALYPIVSILLATLFLQESMTLKQGIGILLAIAAMILITA